MAANTRTMIPSPIARISDNSDAISVGTQFKSPAIARKLLIVRRLFLDVINDQDRTGTLLRV